MPPLTAFPNQAATTAFAPEKTLSSKTGRGEFACLFACTPFVYLAVEGRKYLQIPVIMFVLNAGMLITFSFCFLFSLLPL